MPFLRKHVSIQKHKRLGDSFQQISTGGLPKWQRGKESAYNAWHAGDMGSIPGSRRFPREGHGNRSSILAWEIPWTEEPGRLQSMGSQRGRHDSSEWALTLRGRYGPSRMPWEVVKYLCSPRGSQKLYYDSERKEDEMDVANHSIIAQEGRRGWSPHSPCWTSEPVNLKAHIWTIMLMINQVLLKLF